MESEYSRDDIHKTSVSPFIKGREMGAPFSPFSGILSVGLLEDHGNKHA